MRESSGEAVTVYPVIELPPSEAGAVQDTAEIVVRQRIIRRRQHRPAQGLKRIVEPVQTIERQAQFHPGGGVSGTQAHGLAGLSMGMTDDYAVAIEEGATVVRVGRAIFGERRS